MEVIREVNCFGGVLPKRYYIAILGLIGMIIVHGLNEYLSFEGVSARMMLNHTAISQASHGLYIAVEKDKVLTTEECNVEISDHHITTEPVDGPMEKSPRLMYFFYYIWGWLLGINQGGRRTDSYSVLFFGVTLSIYVCTLLTPTIGWTTFYCLEPIRFLQGVSLGLVYPAIYDLIAKWAPPTKRGFMTTMVLLGANMGPVFSAVVADRIHTTLGWRAVFFISAALSAIWWFLYVYIIKSTHQLCDMGLLPTKQSDSSRAIFETSAFLVILVSYVAHGVCSITLYLWVPIYINDLMKFDLNEAYPVMLVTLMLQTVFSFNLSMFLDWLNGKNFITAITARKISTAFATAVPAVCLVLLCFIRCDHVAAIVLWATAVIASSGITSGVHTNIIDIAPNSAGSVKAVCMTCTLFVGLAFSAVFLFTNITGQQIFIVTTVLYVAVLVIYSVWASSEEQKVSSKEDKEATELTSTQNVVDAKNIPSTQDIQV